MLEWFLKKKSWKYCRKFWTKTIMSEASRQIEQAEVLLLLGTAMNSEVYSKYINHFEGRYLVVILGQPRQILKQLQF